jgi:Asp-tRNA(Asn)/Glu-tRNA(Gln) amidotransferase A subunit family amidase
MCEMVDLNWTPAVELRELIGHDEVSPVDLVRACLEQIDRLDPELHAFMIVDHAGALEAAHQAETAVRTGQPLGPLHGIPVAIKDDVWAKGLPATLGSLLFAKFVPSQDGTVVRRLREAGAIIIGKTNLPEFVSWPRSRSFAAGEARNPWDRSRIPGASSGGSAVAVATGMVPLAIGTDGGGSVRIPSAFCGLAGMLPTIGRVPDHGGFLCSPMSSAGPMARNVADMALLLQVIAGPEPATPWALPEPAPDFRAPLDQGVSGLRIAWSSDFGHIAVDPEIVAASQPALEALARAGAEVDRIADVIPHPWGDGRLMAGVYTAAAEAGEVPFPEGEIPETNFIEAALRACTERAESFFAAPQVAELIGRHMDLLTPPSRAFMSNGQADVPLPSEGELNAAVDTVFADHDVLCSPTMPWIACKIPTGWASPCPDNYSNTNFTFIANATHRPAASVPCGLVDGLPVGFQIIGRPGDEATVLRVASAIEKALPPLPRPPGLG